MSGDALVDVLFILVIGLGLTASLEIFFQLWRRIGAVGLLVLVVLALAILRALI
jgi:hypothetical protein